MPIEFTMDQMMRGNLTREQIEQFDIDMTYLLNSIRKKIKGPSRIIPYLKEKVRRKAVILYWKSRIRKEKGKLIDQYVIENRERYIKNAETDLDLDIMEM